MGKSENFVNKLLSFSQSVRQLVNDNETERNSYVTTIVRSELKPKTKKQNRMFSEDSLQGTYRQTDGWT